MLEDRVGQAYLDVLLVHDEWNAKELAHNSERDGDESSARYNCMWSIMTCDDPRLQNDKWKLEQIKEVQEADIAAQLTRAY